VRGIEKKGRSGILSRQLLEWGSGLDMNTSRHASWILDIHGNMGRLLYLEAVPAQFNLEISCVFAR
jgi:hypothetical protein